MHRTSWPDAASLRDAAADGDPLVYDVAAGVLGEVRKAKTEAKRSLKADVDHVVVADSGARIEALRAAAADVRDAGGIARLDLSDAAEPTITVSLAPETT